jgi:hypothetical protein
MPSAAADLAVVGVLHGLHRCPDGGAGSLTGYSPDYVEERGAMVVRQCHAAAVTLPFDDLAEALTRWQHLFRSGGARVGGSRR